MNKKHASWTGIMAGSIVAVFYGCADDGTTGSSDELLSTESNIAALRGSSQAAQDAAKACFDTFKTCEASAAAGDTTCRDQLKACLPDAPPAAPGCGDGGATGGGRGDGGTSHDAGVRPPPVATGDAGRGDRGRGPGTQGPGAQDPGSRDAGHVGDAGAGHAGPGQGGFGQGGFGQGDQDGRGEHGACGGHFDFPQGALGGCRDNAARSMQHGMGCDGARAEHQACMAHSFADSLAKLCKKASELCAKPGAPADVCTRITSACSSVPQSDAGTTQADAGN